MQLNDAVGLIKDGVPLISSTWADIGAGTGLFTRALMNILPPSRIYAVDKSPHSLWSLRPEPEHELIVVEGDFHRELDIPLVDGIIMANALHYAPESGKVLENVLTYRRPGGTFILVEYDTEEANPPWVPYPVSLKPMNFVLVFVTISVLGIIASKIASSRVTKTFVSNYTN